MIFSGISDETDWDLVVISLPELRSSEPHIEFEIGQVRQCSGGAPVVLLSWP